MMSTYGALPQLDQLDQLKTKRGQKDVTFTAVGYGLQASFPDAAAWKDVANRVHMVAQPKLLQINVPGYGGDFSLLLSNNHATGTPASVIQEAPTLLATQMLPVE